MKTTEWMIKIWNLLLKLYEEKNNKFGVAILILVSGLCVMATYNISRSQGIDKVDYKIRIDRKDSIIQAQGEQLRNCYCWQLEIVS